jgi:hypothetical protein
MNILKLVIDHYDLLCEYLLPKLDASSFCKLFLSCKDFNNLVSTYLKNSTVLHGNIHEIDKDDPSKFSKIMYVNGQRHGRARSCGIDIAPDKITDKYFDAFFYWRIHKPTLSVSVYYISGMLHGLVTKKIDIIDDDSERERCDTIQYSYSYNIIHGIVQVFFDKCKNGSYSSLKICNYINGKRFGKSVLYNDIGMITRKSHYKNGLLDGIKKKYNSEQGHPLIEREEEYKYGKLKCVTTYDARGVIIRKDTYENGEYGVSSIY